jgi:predicted RNase H-like nuclease (RuvC/YqgF family)
LLFDDGALAILDRLMQVQRETGLGLTEAVERIKSELAHSDPGTAEERPKSVHSSADPAVFTKLIAAYEDRIESLERDKAYLQAKLDEALAKLPALPPPRPINLTRWQALKIALLGRS